MPTNTIIENLNSVINTKNEFANIIRENGTNPGTVFSDYPAMIRSIIANGSGDLSSYYVHGDHVCLTDDPDYNLKSLLVNSGAVTWDGTSYDYATLLTENHASEWFPTYSYVESKIPVIDENIIPKENNTYTLGDSTYLYAATYTSDLWTSTKNKISNRSDNQINIQLNNGWKYTFHSNGFSPANANQDLGNGTPWRSTYTANLYADNTYTYNLILNGTNIEDRFTSYLSIANFNQGNNTVQLRTNGLTVISASKAIAPQEMTYASFISASNPWVGGTTMKNYVEGRLADIESRLAALEGN